MTLPVENFRAIAVLSTLLRLFYAACSMALDLIGNTNVLVLLISFLSILTGATFFPSIHFDFKKAFDRIDNDMLLSKLDRSGLSPNVVRFDCYLRDRQQYLCSAWMFRLNNLVEQLRSTLGPLLFNSIIIIFK